MQVVYTQSPAVYGNLISQRRGGVTKYYHFDALGSTDRLTDGSQTVTDSTVYDAWGKIKASSGSTVNPFRFVGSVGYFYDIDLLEYYLRARFYDPASGRFLSQDPIDDGRGWSDYDYVNANPVGDIDPSGLQRWGSDPWSGVVGGIPAYKHRVLVMTAYAAGLRLSELTHLEAADVDASRMLIHVRQGKGQKDRLVPLSTRLLEELRVYWRAVRPHNGCCFPAHGRMLPPLGPWGTVPSPEPTLAPDVAPSARWSAD